MTKFIFCSGGVMSGIGKGIVAASIANLLSRSGFNTTVLKADPYINIDPGTLNPKQHGEVFVTSDGAETDLDLGHYERFIQTPLTKLSSFSTGQVYQSVINKERYGLYNGHTVQIFHIVEEIKSRIYNLANYTNADFLIVELGGTVGDLESVPFLEALRQLVSENDRYNTCCVHLTYVPYLPNVGEFKTKPTQHSINTLRSTGNSPDIIIARSHNQIPPSIISKISKYTYLPSSHIIPCPNFDSIYKAPSFLSNNNLLFALSSVLDIPLPIPDTTWDTIAFSKPTHNLNLAIVGKYSSLQDSYLSVSEAIKHSSLSLSIYTDISYIDVTSDSFSVESLSNFDALVVPGGFGSNGIEPLIDSLHYARINKIPTLGICLGMQLMCIEFFRNYLNLPHSNSTEFDINTSDPIIHILPDKLDKPIGGSLRLGTFPSKILIDSKLYSIYDSLIVYERHRHRYEFNNFFIPYLYNTPLSISSTSPDNQLVESIELSNHPFYIGTQFHPEFQSYLTNPHPLFTHLLETSLSIKKL